MIFLMLHHFASSQGNFRIEDDRSKFELPFQLVSDLVIIPLELNGVKLSFLLDTGVDSTILFSLDKEDSIDVKDASIIYIRGIGEEEPIRALKSTGNSIKIGNSFSNDLSIYISFDNSMNLSSRLGIPVNGIIGYDFFKDFVLDFNYLKKKLIVYNKDRYSPKKCNQCEVLPLTFSKNKPYIEAISKINGKELKLNFLIDSGSGDAIWVFEEDSAGVSLPEVHIDDFLGYGMSGSVYGARSRVESIKLGKFVLNDVTASFPDKTYIDGLKTYDTKNGSIGAKILRRFQVIFDYSRKSVSLKPNRFFLEPFEYDMSGIVIAHDGQMIVKELDHNSTNGINNLSTTEGAGSVIYESTSSVKFKLQPLYKIVEVRPESPAEKVGLQKGDILLEINNKPAYRFSLSGLQKILSSKDGKRIKLKIERGLDKITISFRLKKIL